MMPAPVAAGERVVLAREVLLASCGRFLLNPEMRERLVRAAGEATSADWSEVVEKALHIGGGGLLHHHLTAAGVAPPSELREAYRWIATLNADWEEEHRRIGEALREVDVPVLLIKGAALQERVYQDAGLRYMEDADWVLREETGRAAAIRVLGTLGYRQADSAFPNIWEREDFLIDLHTSFLGDDRIRARTRSARESERGGEAEAGIWERARPSTVGESFFVPAPEDHMLILCNHLMKHSFEPGPWFSDLEALLAAEPGFDWGATLERARAWGVLRSLAYAFWALGALEDGAGASCASIHLPEKIRRTLIEVRPTRLDRMLLSIAAKGERLTGEKTEWANGPPVANLLCLSSADGLRAKFGLLWEAVFPRDEVMAQIYSAYRPINRWWLMAVRTGSLLRLGTRIGVLWIKGRSQRAAVPARQEDDEPRSRARDLAGDRLRARGDVSCRELEEGFVLLDSERGKVHSLNHVAAYIWGCLDGSQTLSEIAGNLREFPGAESTEGEALLQAVLNAVETFRKEGLLEPSSDLAKAD